MMRPADNDVRNTMMRLTGNGVQNAMMRLTGSGRGGSRFSMDANV